MGPCFTVEASITLQRGWGHLWFVALTLNNKITEETVCESIMEEELHLQHFTNKRCRHWMDGWMGIHTFAYIHPPSCMLSSFSQVSGLLTSNAYLMETLMIEGHFCSDVCVHARVKMTLRLKYSKCYAERRRRNCGPTTASLWEDWSMTAESQETPEQVVDVKY